MFDFLHHLLYDFVEYGILLFELAGVTILLCSGIKGIIQYLKREPMTRLNLMQSMAMALNFKLGGEILRTVMLTDLSECLFVGVIVVLRTAISLLIHWEIQHEKEEHRKNHS